MRLTKNIVIIILFSLLSTGTAIAEPYWDDEHHLSYGHHYDTHHNYEPRYTHEAYNDYRYTNYYHGNKAQSYTQERKPYTGVMQNRTQSYYKDNESGNTDFYYFKQDQPRTTHKHLPIKKLRPVKKRVLSSLDLEDKLKTKNDSPNIPTITTTNILQAKKSLSLNKPQCYKKLRKHNIRFASMPSTSGIKYPVKIHSTIGGVRYRNASNRSSFSIMDCRLAAALIGWSKILKQYSIYEVVHMRTYSRGATVKNTNKPSGHSWGLAIDVAKFKSHKYGELNIKYDWSDQRAKISPCIKSLESAQPLKLLRAIVCSTANKQLFTMILTPHYNRAHHDHLHIELRPRLRKLVLR